MIEWKLVDDVDEPLVAYSDFHTSMFNSSELLNLVTNDLQKKKLIDAVELIDSFEDAIMSLVVYES